MRNSYGITIWHEWNINHFPPSKWLDLWEYQSYIHVSHIYMFDLCLLCTRLEDISCDDNIFVLLSKNKFFFPSPSTWCKHHFLMYFFSYVLHTRSVLISYIVFHEDLAYKRFWRSGFLFFRGFLFFGFCWFFFSSLWCIVEANVLSFMLFMCSLSVCFK